MYMLSSKGAVDALARAWDPLLAEEREYRDERGSEDRPWLLPTLWTSSMVTGTHSAAPAGTKKSDGN